MIESEVCKKVILYLRSRGDEIKGGFIGAIYLIKMCCKTVLVTKKLLASGCDTESIAELSKM